MIAVIIAGGSGTRLWPLSVPSFPKHLLKVKDELSLLQRAYVRACLLTDKIIIVTEASHAHQVRKQLPSLPGTAFIIEPDRRGPAYCMLAALIEVDKRYDPDEPIAFMYPDHYIQDEDGFKASLQAAEKVSASLRRVVLIGLTPTYPSTGFGYIHKGQSVTADFAAASEVLGFCEKPDYEVARTYVESGEYLWNAGYYVGSVHTFRGVIQEYAPALYSDFVHLSTARDYDKAYLALKEVNLGDVLSKGAKDLLVIPATFDWMDIGSFNDMHEVMDKDIRGNYSTGNIEAEQVHDSFLQNVESKPLVVIGLESIVVVNTPNGILVTRKDLSQQVGVVSKRVRRSDYDLVERVSSTGRVNPNTDP